MKKKGALILFLILLTFVFSAAAQNNPAAQTQSYEELLAKLKSGDAKIDFKALRTAYSESKNYSPYGTNSTETNSMFKALKDKKYKDAIKLADEILKDNYVEMNSHYVASMAYEQSGDKEKAEFHKAVFLGLIKSIVSGKDGKSAKTSYEVISVPEEYVVINVLGFQRGSQSLVREDGHTFDVLEVTDSKTKEAVKLYFNIDIVFKGYNKVFGK